jgi:TetR/AcrR family transcriptional regulator, cholesterol catabolism regulator
MDRRLTRRGEERKRQLMAFAAERFASNGYHPTSVAEIVEGLGVGKGVFYWYFDSKEALFLAILADAQRDLRRRQGDAIRSAGDPIERIEAGLRASMRWSAEHPEMYRLFQLAASEEGFAKALHRGEQVAVDEAAAEVRAAMAAGRIPDGDPVLIANAMIGVSNRLLARGLLDASGIDAAVAFCLHGVLGADVTPTTHTVTAAG